MAPDDYGRFARFAQRRMMVKTPKPFLKIIGVLVLAVVILAFAMFYIEAQEAPPRLVDIGEYTILFDIGVLFSLILVLILFGIRPLWSAHKEVASSLVSDDGPMIGETLASFTEEGVFVKSAHMQTLFKWSAFGDVAQHKGAVYMMVDHGAGLILPQDAFADKKEREHFVATMKERLQNR